MKTKAIIVDLDSTLCDADHRIHVITQDKTHVEERFGNSVWEEFYAELINDTPNEWCVLLVKGMWELGIKPIYLTGRPEKYRDLTLKWFGRFNSYPLSREYVGDHLYMRSNADSRKDCIMKEYTFKTLIQPTYDVLFCLDDRRQVIDMWRDLGLVCLACDDGKH